MNKLFSTSPIIPKEALAVFRIIIGIFLIYHGREVFDRARIEEYSKWDVIQKMSYPLFMSYLGKGMELITGIFIALGLLTRLASLSMAITMLFITFKIGLGKFYEEDQHPFLFALIGIVFFFIGPVKWSIDQLIFGAKSKIKNY
ncbi:MAG: DoxX family protein [Saprospiraceae bacterium]